MRILVCGSRNWTKKGIIRRIIEQSQADTVIHGACRGADEIAGEIAKSLGLDIIKCPAEWESYGRAAGPVRNQQMLKHKPDIVFAFHEDIENSKGTKDMITRAMRAGIPVRIIPGID